MLAGDIDNVDWALWQGRTVYVPRDGLGTGLSRLPEKAPMLHHYLVTRFKMMPGETCPWEGGGR